MSNAESVADRVSIVAEVANCRDLCVLTDLLVSLNCLQDGSTLISIVIITCVRVKNVSALTRDTVVSMINADQWEHAIQYAMTVLMSTTQIRLAGWVANLLGQFWMSKCGSKLAQIVCLGLFIV
jgi:hypothetical protein